MIDELIGQNQVGMICLYSSKEVMRLYEKYGFIQKENYFVMYTEYFFLLLFILSLLKEGYK